MKPYPFIVIASAALLLFSCTAGSTFVDKNATPETKALADILKSMAKRGIAFGHQETTSYGVGWRAWDEAATEGGVLGNSDVFRLVGDYPAVFGFEIGNAEHRDSLASIDGIPFSLQKKLIRDAYKHGGIVTISWHVDNPLTGGDSWDITPAVAAIFADEAVRATFDGYLKNMAAFLLELKDVPVIFRPWHEMNGGWFWWGGKNRSGEDYIKLWKYTVETLRDKYGVHHLLYCYSPNKPEADDEYMAQYPSDEYVDLFGFDIYDFGSNSDYVKSLTAGISLMKRIATEKNKPFALTETGLEAIPDSTWWTKTLLPAVTGTGISYLLVWRNACNRPNHFYAPYPGQISADDFRKFYDNKETIFLNEIQNAEE
jgi:mannan endo-1,4-beta-mannosidase